MTPPLSIAYYRITARLGEGGMGTVYRATDIKLGRDVAIKVLPDAFAQDADRVARFTREAQGLAALNHPKHRRPFMASKTARWWLDDEACFQVMRYTLNKGGVLRGRPAVCTRRTANTAKKPAARAKFETDQCGDDPQELD